MVDGARSTLWSGRYKSGMENTQIIIFLKFRHVKFATTGLQSLIICHCAIRYAVPKPVYVVIGCRTSVQDWV